MPSKINNTKHESNHCRISIYPSQQEVFESLSSILHDLFCESAKNSTKKASLPAGSCSNNFKADFLNCGQNKVKFDRKVILDFVSYVCNSAKLNAECCSLIYIYIKRFLEITEIPIGESNWMKILFISALTSQKVFSSNHLDTYEFVQLFPEMDVETICLMEIEFLNLFSCKYEINSEIFERHYNELNKKQSAGCLWLYNVEMVKRAIYRSKWMTPDENDGDLTKFVSISKSTLNLDELEDM
ncbi:unnamed protein product [Blepharisma stoltei]|uniref:Cyclin N-terminal domain-containing protein n=1 Tax=Blepharisma stoltei TaxID=1481888 RepID=A0AAU9IVV0_9CILI|nr:unnamed protein product [Blepharisma stoltei]